jgi:hypothetical protein
MRTKRLNYYKPLSLHITKHQKIVMLKQVKFMIDEKLTYKSLATERGKAGLKTVKFSMYIN